MDEPVNEGSTAPLPEQVPNAASAESVDAVSETPIAPQVAYEPTPGAPPVSYERSVGTAAHVHAEPAQVRAPRVWHIRARWVVIAASVLGGLLLLGVAFGVGVKVGAHASGFERRNRGMMLQAPYERNGRSGWQNAPYGNDYRGYGGHGRILPSPDTTNTP